MYRKIDSTGRLCIPVEMREKINLDVNSEVRIELFEDEIIITNTKKEDDKKELKNKIKELSNKKTSNKEALIEEIIKAIDIL